MGLVPILRYLPIVFAGCMAATLYVLILAEPFRNCLVILLIQWTLNVAAMAILSFALTNIVHFMVPAQPESTELAAQQDPNVAPRPPEVRAATRPKPHRLTRRPEGKPEKAPEPETPKPAEGEASPAAGSDLKAALADHKGNPESSFAQLREQLHALDEHAKPYLEPIETACAPYTKYLPEPVQEFLEDGGWWLVFAALAVAVLFWLRALYRRGKRALFHKHRHHRKARRAHGSENPLVIDLDLVGDAFSDPGPHQIAVRGQPGRLRLVVLAPSSGYAGDLLPEMAESLLDWIQPGLGEIVASDSPRVVVWPRHPSVGRFTEVFHKLVQAPEVKGRRSPWVLLSGAAHLGRQTVFLGLAVFLDKTTYQREIEVAREKWGEVLSVQKVVEPV
jgi:hypothetical protein